MECHGSWSKGTKAYWKMLVHAATRNERQKTREFPVHLSVLTRRVLQTLAVALRRVNASRILQFRHRTILMPSGGRSLRRSSQASKAAALTAALSWYPTLLCCSAPPSLNLNIEKIPQIQVATTVTASPRSAGASASAAA